ncbi:MAG: type II secretion system protein GspL [Candidatus Binatia bacterium]
MAIGQRLQDLSRADFLRSVGLYVMQDRLVMVRLRKSLLNVALLDQQDRELPHSDTRPAIADITGWVAEDVKEIALKAENDSRERSLRQAMVSLLPHFNAGRDAVYLCIPQDQVIMQQIFLPLAAQDTIEQVLQYEIERQMPFRRDEIYYDYLATGKKGERLSLYVIAVQKKIVDGLVSLLESFGIKPAGVEPDVTALLNYALYATRPKNSRTAILAASEHSWDLLGVESKATNWSASQQFLFAHRMPHSEWAQGAGRELLLQNLADVDKCYRWGNLGDMTGLPAEKFAAAEELQGLDGHRFRGLKSPLPEAALPAVGAALRGIREAAVIGNFLRHENPEPAGGNSLSMLNAVLGGLLALALVAWGLSYPVKDEMRLRQLQRENQKFEAAIEALRREENQLQQLSKEVGTLAELQGRRGEVLKILDELSKVVPNNAHLSNLRYRAGVLEVQGNAENASALIPLLERSPVFENVAFNAPSNRGRDNRETFSLKAEVEKLKAAASEPPAQAPLKEVPKVAPKDNKAKS